MPQELSDAEARPPADFAPILATKDPVLLVGGQAVNLWALYYQDKTSDLAPFVSRDADVLGDRETLSALAKLAGAKPQFFPLRPPSNEVGVVIAKDANGSPLLIEVLRYVHGATNEELREPAYTLALGKNQVKVQVPGPIALLQAKLANVADLNQAGRQDARHVIILTRLLPSYLEELRKSTIEGRMEERKLIQFLERLLVVTMSKNARKVFAELNLNPAHLFSRLSPDSLPKVRAFLEKRLPRILSATPPRP
jgi:hypothetical protein